MDVILEYAVKGSPWAFTLLFLGIMVYSLTQIKREYARLIERRDEIMKKQEERLQELNFAYKTTILDQSNRMESILKATHAEMMQLQERHTCAIMELQKESIRSAAILNATLTGLIEAIRANGD